MGDRITLAIQGARSLGAIGADAVAWLLGRGLPISPADLAQPTVLEDVLVHGALPGRRSLAHPSTVEATGAVAPSSNCVNTTLALTWAPDTDGARTPETLFVKQSAAHLPTRLFATVVGFWETECAVCRALGQEAPIPMARVHAVTRGRSRFVIVMEDLLAREDARLFVNRDLLEGVDLDRARRCLRTLARLHAAMAGRGQQERESVLPLALHPYLSPTRAPVTAILNRLAVDRCRRRAPDTFGDRQAQLYRRALDHWDELLQVWYREPLTLLHGDSHLGNFFESDGETGMIDFQGAHWGRGSRDIQYFLINSMAPELLARHEADLVAGYCEDRVRFGAPVPVDEAFDDYRGLSFQTLMTAVVSIGLGSFTDSEDVMQMMLERSVTAVDRLDFPGWLDDLTGNQTPTTTRGEPSS